MAGVRSGSSVFIGVSESGVGVMVLVDVGGIMVFVAVLGRKDVGEDVVVCVCVEVGVAVVVTVRVAVGVELCVALGKGVKLGKSVTVAALVGVMDGVRVIVGTKSGFGAAHTAIKPTQ
ncbi:MAG: hypothetical protein EHM41_01255 [Chloroflexi bacterium]|nr:MAG: hypothetical protein EHM41_01255 [Chloroflexota bacterium]